jgi:hypothetical protein
MKEPPWTLPEGSPFSVVCRNSSGCVFNKIHDLTKLSFDTDRFGVAFSGAFPDVMQSLPGQAHLMINQVILDITFRYLHPADRANCMPLLSFSLVFPEYRKIFCHDLLTSFFVSLV